MGRMGSVLAISEVKRKASRTIFCRVRAADMTHIQSGAFRRSSPFELPSPIRPWLDETWRGSEEYSQVREATNLRT